MGEWTNPCTLYINMQKEKETTEPRKQKNNNNDRNPRTRQGGGGYHQNKPFLNLHQDIGGYHQDRQDNGDYHSNNQFRGDYNPNYQGGGNYHLQDGGRYHQNNWNQNSWNQNYQAYGRWNQGMDRGNRIPLQLTPQQENNKKEGIFKLTGSSILYMGRDKAPPKLLIKINEREQGICFRGSCLGLFCKSDKSCNYPHIKDVKDVKEGLGHMYEFLTRTPEINWALDTIKQ